MKISEHIKNTIDSWSEEYKDKLRGWLLRSISEGVFKFTEDLEPGAIDGIRDLLTQVKDNPNTPEDIRALIDRSLTPGHPLLVALGIVMIIVMIVPMMFGLMEPLSRLNTYGQERLFRSGRLDPLTANAARLRGEIDEAKFNSVLTDHGFNDADIATLWELAHIIPPLADMVRFADFSAFDPDVIAKWRQFYDAPGWVTDPFSLIGITNKEPRDWANKYWFSHWRQPGRYELGDMYRRGLLGKPLIGQDEIGGGKTEGEAEEIIKLAYKTMGYSSFWQDSLLDLVREVPTRVDVRRWWDMRTIDETELRSIYQRQGYFGKDLENYVLWTKVYVAFPDLIARWKNGWITEDDVRSELTGLGMPADRLEEMIQTKIKAAQPERTAKEKDLTKTEIYKGVKKGVITWAEGIELLLDLGYDEDEADYILTINVEALEGSPETFEEFKSITQKWRKAVGMEAKPMSEELIAAGAELVKLTKDIEALQAALKDEEATLIDVEELPEKATAKRDELRVTLHRAESALRVAQTNYDSLLAQWRHKKAE